MILARWSSHNRVEGSLYILITMILARWCVKSQRWKGNGGRGSASDQYWDYCSPQVIMMISRNIQGGFFALPLHFQNHTENWEEELKKRPVLVSKLFQFANFYLFLDPEKSTQGSHKVATLYELMLVFMFKYHQMLLTLFSPPS